MRIIRTNLSAFDPDTDLLVAIDVLRAFTTASYLFSVGVEEIILVSQVHEAFKLREEMPECLICGEVDGIKVPGFDFGNSPSEIITKNVSGKRIIQRTSAGTQAVALYSKAGTTLTSALTNISATVRCIQKYSPATVTLLQTGLFLDEGWGDEDAACAEAIEQILLGNTVDWTRMIERVRGSRSGMHYDGSREDFPPEDLEMALRIDTFNFAMMVEKKNQLNVMRCISV